MDLQEHQQLLAINKTTSTQLQEQLDLRAELLKAGKEAFDRCDYKRVKACSQLLQHTVDPIKAARLLLDVREYNDVISIKYGDIDA